MLRNLLENLRIPTTPVEERTRGPAFLRVAREAYPIATVVYVALNLMLRTKPKQYAHCIYASEWAKHCISVRPVDLLQLGLERLFREDVGWGDVVALFSEHTSAPCESVDGFVYSLPCKFGGKAAVIVVAPTDAPDWLEQKAFIGSDFRALSHYFHKHMMRIFGLADETAEVAISRREIDCLRWIAAGKSLQEVGIILGISERTVRFHLNAAREKLNCVTTTQAVAKAVSQNLFAVE